MRRLRTSRRAPPARALLAGGAPRALPRGAGISSRGRALLGAATVWLAAALLAAGSATATPAISHRFAAEVSSNWAGYAATATPGSSAPFKSVSAHWVQPSVACTGRPAYSGFWVGLGGFHRFSNALEQIGTEADCSVSGHGTYYAWYEFVPRGPVRLTLTVHPGDTIAASVTVSGQRVTLALRDLSTRASYAARRRASATDVSSAEWIAEAPSVCVGQSCRVLPLANFGSVPFSAAAATTTTGDRGPAGASSWSLTALELLDLDGESGPSRLARSATVATAAPTSLTSSGSAFTVAWQQVPAPTGAPVPMGPFAG